jgi:serine/threonine protein kinase
MATLAASVRDYCALVARSKLLPADEVEGLYRRWAADGRGADGDVDAFRKFLVARKHLTEYQAVMLQRGHADGFFLGGYKILDRIGKGQMGGVYEAAHASGQVVALKILAGSKARDPHTLGRFQREARLLTQLDHPNVVRAFQLGEAGGVHFIVMEVLDGETLDEVLARRKALPPAEAVRLASQALRGLQHLHDRRMVHRDLKPANLMLVGGAADSTWAATVKILDIGLGRELFADDAPDGQFPTQLTVEGALLGTPDYLAPEQARDARSADHRADVYSLGCVLYHALTGGPPFPAGTVVAQMLRHATEPPAPVPGVPPGLQAVLDRMLAKSPDDRFPSAGEAADALAAFVAPNAGSAPHAAVVVPAYRQWLETESQVNLNLPKPQSPATAVLPTVNPPTAPAPALPKPPAPRPPRAEEVEVELVTLPPPQVIVREPEPRAVWQLDRRDLVMLGLGGVGVLSALGLGYGLALLVRKRPSGEPESGERPA